MEIIEGGVYVPEKKKFKVGDMVVALDGAAYIGGNKIDINKLYKVLDVDYCEYCGEEYITINNDNFINDPYLYYSCKDCSKNVYLNARFSSQSKNFISIMEARRLKIEKIKYNKLNLFGKLLYRIENKNLFKPIDYVSKR